MKKLIYLILFLFVFSLTLPAYSSSEGEAFLRGREIMGEVDAKNRCTYETTKIRMDIIDKKGRVRVRRLTIYKKRDEQGNLKILIRFTAPKDVKGTGLLTIDHTKSEADQWVYLPILRKNKRIVLSR